MYEQKIYFGAPGTGKSYLIDKKLTDECISKDKIFRVVIHPEYTYSDFIGQLLPENIKTDSGEEKVNFVFKEGPFTRALMEAYNDLSQDVYLIIEELSRGNTAGIFGDIFQLLDRDKHFESRYPINNKNIADKIPTLVGDDIKLPSNFNILCTVNTNDQNVFPMDTAFKRRFEWEYVSTAPVKIEESEQIDLNINNPKIILINKSQNKIETNWLSFYTQLNDFIVKKMGKNEDRQLGQFFLEFNEALIKKSYSEEQTEKLTAQNEINKIIKNKLLLYLWQDVQNCSISNTDKNLFDRKINSFEELYEIYGKEKVFSDEFFAEYKNNLYNNADFE